MDQTPTDWQYAHIVSGTLSFVWLGRLGTAMVWTRLCVGNHCRRLAFLFEKGPSLGARFGVFVLLLFYLYYLLVDGRVVARSWNLHGQGNSGSRATL